MGKPKTVTVIWPTPEEDAAITAAALSDPDAQPLTDEELAGMRPVWDYPELVAVLQKEGKLGRPPLPATEKKQRVTLHLDPDVLARLREGGKGWQTRANAALRGALGLDVPRKG
ncbi:MAG: BrnA antitoxin family protein [Gemmobacter sp.]